MSEKMNSFIQKLAVSKKKIILTVVVIAVLFAAGIGGYVGIAYNYAKKNDNYTEAQIKEIALSYIDGEVISVQKDFEIEDDRLSHSEFEYEVEIKTDQNTLQEVVVHSRTGTIELDDHDYHHEH